MDRETRDKYADCLRAIRCVIRGMLVLMEHACMRRLIDNLCHLHNLCWYSNRACTVYGLDMQLCEVCVDYKFRILHVDDVSPGHVQALSMYYHQTSPHQLVM